jgi:glycosidase
MRMTFVSNHDKNAWDGTEFEQFGEGLEPAMVLSAMGEGMPLVYNGQEAGNSRRLQFFERDPIVWKTHPNGDLYRKLFALRKKTSALWNAHWGATMIAVPNSCPDRVFSFVRRNSRDGVFVILNFSEQPQTVAFEDSLYHGRYANYFGGQLIEMTGSAELHLQPWAYRVFVNAAPGD